MERLTERTNLPGFLPVLLRGRALGPAYFQEERDYTDYSDALERLAAYEDTGLEPEEIAAMLYDTPGPPHKKIWAWIDAERAKRRERRHEENE